MPVNVLIIRGLLNMYLFYGDEFRVECPTGSGKYMTLFEVAKDTALRLGRIFLRDESGRSPVYGGRRNSRKTRIGGTTSCSMSIFMATMVLGWAPVIRRAGQGLSHQFSICSHG